MQYKTASKNGTTTIKLVRADSQNSEANDDEARVSLNTSKEKDRDTKVTAKSLEYRPNSIEEFQKRKKVDNFDF